MTELETCKLAYDKMSKLALENGNCSAELLIKNMCQTQEIKNLKEVLDLIMVEIDSNPTAVRYFDLRIIKRARILLKPKPVTLDVQTGKYGLKSIMK